MRRRTAEGGGTEGEGERVALDYLNKTRYTSSSSTSLASPADSIHRREDAERGGGGGEGGRVK
jgi:hypothetical protein